MPTSDGMICQGFLRKAEDQKTLASEDMRFWFIISFYMIDLQLKANIFIFKSTRVCIYRSVQSAIP